MSEFVDLEVTITANKKLNDRYYMLEFESPEFAKSLEPGQFLNLKINSTDCYLRRPFSVYDIQGDTLQILYMIVGVGTEVMSQIQPGETMEMLGPLGNGFEFPEKDTKVIIIAGGTGIGSVYSYYARLKEEGYADVTLACGFKEKAFFFDGMGDEVEVYTEDGSLGKKGYVTDILNDIPVDAGNVHVYACGPHAMFKTIKENAKFDQYPVTISMEEHMACGIGVCLGCVVETNKGYETVCKAGPTFNLQDVVIN